MNSEKIYRVIIEDKELILPILTATQARAIDKVCEQWVDAHDIKNNLIFCSNIIGIALGTGSIQTHLSKLYHTVKNTENSETAKLSDMGILQLGLFLIEKAEEILKRESKPAIIIEEERELKRRIGE